MKLTFPHRALVSLSVLVLVAGCSGSGGGDDHPFTLDYEMIPEELDFLDTAELYSGSPIPAELQDEAVELGWEACWQFTQGTDEESLAERFEEVGWSPNADEWGVIAMAAATDLCPDAWDDAVARYGD